MEADSDFHSDDVNVFIPDYLTLDQFNDSRRPVHYQCPEKNLLLAILEEAVFTLQSIGYPVLHKQYKSGGKNQKKTYNNQKKLYNNIVNWIESKDHSTPFTFEYICDNLGFDGDYFRQGVLRQIQRIECMKHNEFALKPRKLSTDNESNNKHNRHDPDLSSASTRIKES